MMSFQHLYAAGLREYLQAKAPARSQQKAAATLGPAAQLGKAASGLGLAMLEVARIHERAVVGLELTAGQGAPAKRAEAFFTEVVAPIVASQRAARESRTDRKRLQGSLGRRTAELAAANRQLERGVARHRGMVSALKASGERQALLLKESLRLQEDFRLLTHQALAAQEAERLKISRELHDEVAQTLLGINVRLVSLKHEARGSARGLKAEIASTQKLAIRSVRSVRLVARRLGKT